MQNVLALIDFSEVTPRVVESAVELAGKLSGKLWLIHVAPPDPEFVGYEPGPQTVRDQVADKLHNEHRKLQEMADAIRAQGVDVTPLLVQGQTVETILEEAKRAGADLLVLGSHGHSPLRKALLGSVTNGVLQKATCPVLIIPPKT